MWKVNPMDAVDDTPLSLALTVARALAENPLTTEVTEDTFQSMAVEWTGIVWASKDPAPTNKGCSFEEHLFAVLELISVGFTDPAVAGEGMKAVHELEDEITPEVFNRMADPASLLWASLLREANYDPIAVRSYSLGTTEMDWIDAIRAELRSHEFLN